MKRVLLLVGLGLFAVGLFILLLTSNLRGLLNEMRLYQWGFERYGISQAIGIPEQDLLRAARKLVDYFNLKSDSPQVQVSRNGEEIKLFNERELAHLRDVRNLVQRCYQVQWASLAYVLTYLVAGFIWLRRAFLSQMAKAFLFGGLLTILALAAVGIWAAVDFESFFLAFHLTSFRNQLWLLDPTRDYLIAMFPEGFFFHTALFLSGAVIVEAIILASASAVYLWRARGSSAPTALATGGRAGGAGTAA